MPSPIIPILLAGGAGTRLWPVSRDALPKQFLPLVGERSTYQETLARVQDPMFGAPIVITGPNFHFFAKRQAEDIGVEATVVIEPLRRDSAPAIAAATAVARKRDPDAVVLALAADHIILDAPQFRATCLAGRAGADAGRIVTFGIKPSEPKTSYGYILPGAGDRRRRARGRALRREAGRRHRRALRQGRLSVEFRQLPVPRRRAAGRARAARAGNGRGGRRRGRQGHHRSRLPAARPGGLRARAAEVDRLCGDGKDRPRRGGRGRLPLVRHRLVGRAVRHHAARRRRQRAARAGGDHGRARLRRAFRRAARPPWSASTIWWW